MIAAFILSGLQFPLFDCNKVPVLSVIAGAITLLLIYATAEVIYAIARSDRSTRAKLLTGLGGLFGGLILVATSGSVAVLTHICP
jgi:membrane associated rhomboid family serine protease